MLADLEAMAELKPFQFNASFGSSFGFCCPRIVLPPQQSNNSHNTTQFNIMQDSTTNIG